MLSAEAIRVVESAMKNAKRFQQQIPDPDVRLCIEELVYIVEVLVNLEVRRSHKGA